MAAAANKPLNDKQFADELFARLADREGVDVSRAEVGRILDEMRELVLDELANGTPVTIAKLVRIVPRVAPARKARMGRKPFTGEPMKVAARAASIKLRARPLRLAKEAVPSTRSVVGRRLVADAEKRAKVRAASLRHRKPKVAA